MSQHTKNEGGNIKKLEFKETMKKKEKKTITAKFVHSPGLKTCETFGRLR